MSDSIQKRNVAKKACDSCRSRKSKCGSDRPTCENCQNLGVPCTFSSPSKRRGPKPRTDNISVRATALQVGSDPSPVDTNHGLGGSSFDEAEDTTIIPPDHSSFSAATPSVIGANTPSSLAGWRNSQHRILDGRATECQFLTALRDDLHSSIWSVRPDTSIKDLVHELIDMYMSDLFPITPLIHEPSIRHSVLLLCPDHCLTAGVHYDTDVVPLGQVNPGMAKIREFTLITAMCAMAALRLDRDASELSAAFFMASTAALRHYEIRDIENPDSSSIVIRVFHSGVVHAAGRARASWYILGEAMRLVQDMRLHDEESLRSLSLVEAQIRRNVFWQLYTADKSAGVLNKRPFTLHEFSLDSSITIDHSSTYDQCLMDGREEQTICICEQRLCFGYNLCQRVFASAFEVILEMRLHERDLRQGQSGVGPGRKQQLTNLYLDFVGVLDDAPAWIQDPNSVENPNHQRSLWIQRANLLVSFHCLRMTILDNFVALGLSALLGVSEDLLMIDLRRTEIARDMLLFIQHTPFEALKACGEACAEKIRLIGTSLLEVFHNARSTQLVTRAGADCAKIVDVLARFDSKATDVLCNELGVQLAS